jgi:hypothetical protein
MQPSRGLAANTAKHILLAVPDDAATPVPASKAAVSIEIAQRRTEMRPQSLLRNLQASEIS